MKAKYVVPLIFIVAVAIYTGNWIYGNISAKKLDLYLQQFPVHSRPLYTDIKVNPLCSKITFKNFSFAYPDAQLKIECDVLYIKMKHREAMTISKTQKVDKLTRLGLDFENVKLISHNEPVFIGKNIIFDFDGDMSHQKLMDMSGHFPDEKQELRLKIKEGAWVQQATKDDWLTHFPVESNRLDYADVKISLNHSERTIDVDKLKINAGELRLEGNAMVNYRGQGLNGFTPSQISMKYDCQSEDSLSWGDSDEPDRYSVQSFNSAFKGDLKLDENSALQLSLSEVNFSLNVQDFKVQYGGETLLGMEPQLLMLGLDRNDLSVDNFTFNTSVSDGRCIVENTKLIMPALEATLNADIKIYGVNMDSSEIETMEMRISNIEPNLNASLTNFERMFGFKIPRDGDVIVLKVTGSLENPQVKGVHY